jgi:hypothetical protein
VVAERLEREAGVRLTGSASLWERAVSARFSSLSLEEGLKEILAGFNYVIQYDAEKRPAAVFVYGAGVPAIGGSGKVESAKSGLKGTGESEKTRGTGEPMKGLPSQSVKVIEPGDSQGPKAVGGSEVPGGRVTISPEEEENFRIIKNAPPPGGPVDGTDPYADRFKIIKNAPPPGSETEQGPK